MLLGKNVYSDTPVTLAIDEGKQGFDAWEPTGRIVQVGTLQRSNFNFLRSINDSRYNAATQILLKATLSDGIAIKLRHDQTMEFFLYEQKTRFRESWATDGNARRGVCVGPASRPCH